MATSVYLLDNNYDAVELIDPYVSVVWSERYSEPGDLVLKLLPDSKWINLLVEGRFIGIDGSNRVMVIEGGEYQRQNGETFFTVTGRTLESLLEAREIGVSGTFTDTPPGYICHYLVRWGYQFNVAPMWDNLNEDRLVLGGYPSDLTINYALKDGNISDLVKEIANANDYGIKLLPNGNGSQMRFDVYKGVNRPDMIFGTAAGTLNDPTYTLSNKGWKNYAIVYYKQAGSDVTQALSVYAPNADRTSRGFNLRSLRVDAKDIDSSQLNFNTYIDMVYQRGIVELAKHRKVKLFTGSVNPNPDLKYGVNFFLGDTGYLQGDTAAMNQQVRVSEYIFSSDDQNGDQQYPTFAVVD